MHTPHSFDLVYHSRVRRSFWRNRLAAIPHNARVVRSCQGGSDITGRLTTVLNVIRVITPTTQEALKQGPSLKSPTPSTCFLGRPSNAASTTPNSAATHTAPATLQCLRKESRTVDGHAAKLARHCHVLQL